MTAGEISNPQMPPAPGKLSPEEFARDILRVDLWHKQADAVGAAGQSSESPLNRATAWVRVSVPAWPCFGFCTLTTRPSC